MKQVFGTVVMGAAALLLFLGEWNSGRRARAGQAVVVEVAYAGRSGLTFADVSYVVKGKPIRATLRAWFGFLRPGQRVPILYFPSDPNTVVLDWFWQRHFGSMLALALFMVVAAVERQKLIASRRRPRSALLRDDYVGPRVGSRGIPWLAIDTAPRLWDRDLDGEPSSGSQPQ